MTSCPACGAVLGRYAADALDRAEADHERRPEVFPPAASRACPACLRESLRAVGFDLDDLPQPPYSCSGCGRRVWGMEFELGRGWLCPACLD